LTTAIGQEAEEAYTNKAVGKNMQKKPPQELLGSHCHQLLLIVMRIVLPAERDIADDSGIAMNA
jgi:hypothetical protein